MRAQHGAVRQAFDRRHLWHPIEDLGVDAHGLGILDEARCLDLLGGEPVGRLGFSAGSLPVIFPVNYLLVDRTVVFRSEDGAKIRAASQGSVACLEVDHFESLEHAGWSVLATGRLGLVPPGRVGPLDRMPLTPWGLTEANQFVELPIELISGRFVGQI